MTKGEIIADINLTKWQMYRMNVNSPHYKDLKRHIKKMEKELRKYGN